MQMKFILLVMRICKLTDTSNEFCSMNDFHINVQYCIENFKLFNRAYI